MYKHLANKRILLGITGGIAAYKILELIRRLKAHQVQVKVIMTAAAKEFITPLSVQALAGEKIYDTLLSAENEAAMSHIELARWAEVLLVAPASANFIAKFKYGQADDLLTTVCLATTAPVLIAPAMNQQMWLNSATQDNISALQQRSFAILGPNSGSQACGEFGPGRMLEANELLECLAAHFAHKILSHKHIVITAGPTIEAIDPVRFISNHSSGKMGYALARAALQLGAYVTLISGPCKVSAPQDPNLKFMPVNTAAEMHLAVTDSIQKAQRKVDIFIGCAAVADYRPAQHQVQKIKKTADSLTIQLERTTDILASVAQLPSDQRPITIGFAAETENLIANAIKKLQSKNLDMIIANAVDNGKIFDQDFSQVVVLGKDLKPIELPSMRKDVLAFKLLSEYMCLDPAVVLSIP